MTSAIERRIERLEAVTAAEAEAQERPIPDPELARRLAFIISRGSRPDATADDVERARRVQTLLDRWKDRTNLTASEGGDLVETLNAARERIEQERRERAG